MPWPHLGCKRALQSLPSGSQTLFGNRLPFRNSVSILVPYLAPIITPDQGNCSFTLLVCRRITPMLGRSDETCAHWIVSYVLQLLPDGFIAVKRLRMKPFLPYLIRAGAFMQKSRLAQNFQMPISAFGFELLNQAPGGELLQVSHHAR